MSSIIPLYKHSILPDLIYICSTQDSDPVAAIQNWSLLHTATLTLSHPLSIPNFRITPYYWIFQTVPYHKYFPNVPTIPSFKINQFGNFLISEFSVSILHNFVFFIVEIIQYLQILVQSVTISLNINKHIILHPSHACHWVSATTFT
jgi:hypothetical protein